VGHWLKLQRQAPGRVVIIPYELLLRDPVAATSEARAVLPEGEAKQCFAGAMAELGKKGTLRGKGMNGVQMSTGVRWDAMVEHYMSCGYTAKLTPAQVAIIRDATDNATLAAVGYVYERPGCLVPRRPG
jgi:hypothetical protein